MATDEKLWMLCANCGRACAADGSPGQAVQGEGGSEWFCGLNCMHSVALDKDNTRLVRRDGKVTAAARKARAKESAIGESPEWTSYRTRLFNDEVDESSNALFVYHAYVCNAVTFRQRNIWLR